MADAPPTLINLFGPSAVGKMTVGQELCRRTGYKLFHGHVVIDVLTPYFVRLARTWRRMFFEEALQAGLNLVLTTSWRFDVPADAETIWSWLQPYAEGGGRVLCVELLAPLEVRLQRNRTENRRRNKDVSWATDAYLTDITDRYRYDSGGAIPFDLPFLRLETEHLTVQETVDRICARFDLPAVAQG